MDIKNDSDCQLLAEAAEWYADGGDDAFVTSDKDDFTDDEESESSDGQQSTRDAGLPATLAELGLSSKTLQKKVNHHVSGVYDSIDSITIYEADVLVSQLRSD